MPLWFQPPAEWAGTMEEVMALPSWWGVEARFLEMLFSRWPDGDHTALIKTYTAFRWNSYVVPQYFNFVLYEALLILLAVGFLRHIIPPTFASRLPLFARRIDTLFTKHCTLSPLIGRNNLYSVSLFSPKRRLAAWTTVQVPLTPTGLLVLFYLLANLLIVSTGYEPMFPSAFQPDDPTPFMQNIRYVADRAGILALGSTPLVVLLAARNSPLNWLAGMDFGTMQIWHRWVARATFTNAFAGGWILCFAAWRRLRQLAYELFLVGHIIAAIAWIVFAYMHVLWLHGGNPYQLRLCYLAASAWAFDRLIRLFSLLWNNTPLGRLIRLSPPAAFKASRTLAAHGALLPGSNDFLRLRITPTSPWPRRRGGPGGYVFISSWTTFKHKGWESHPFSIAWPLGVPDPDEAGAEGAAGACPCDEGCGGAMPCLQRLGSSDDDGDGAETPTKLDHLGASSAVVSAPPSPPLCANERAPDPHSFDLAPSTGSFELLIKRYSGFTRALASSLSLPLSSLPSSSSSSDAELALASTQLDLHALRIAVEGPYGASLPHAAGRYRAALLVAGGSGVAMVTAQLADVGTQVLRRACRPPGEEVRTERVGVVWSVREAETVHLLAPYLTRLHALFAASPSFAQSRLSPRSSPSCSSRQCACAPSDPGPEVEPEPFIDLHLHLTSPLSPLSSAREALEALQLPREFLRVTVHRGRPDIGARIDALAALQLRDEGGEGEGKELLVVSCGPAALCDEAREAVRSRLRGLKWPSVPAGLKRRKTGVKVEESETGGETAEEDEAEGLLSGRERSEGAATGEGKAERRSEWEACELVYGEEAVVW
ncbi:hypothetical protein JCM10207_006187 [Rhodosporidiobolus poonsookiae]